jgi:hypothetical protein
MTTGDELESTSALILSLVNFDDDMRDPTASVGDFGGFYVPGNGEYTKEVVEGADSDEGYWRDAFDTTLV